MLIFHLHYANRDDPGQDLTQIQCCVDVPCKTSSEEYGYCVNSDKACVKTIGRPYVPVFVNPMHFNFSSLVNLAFSGDCPTANTKCCSKETLVNEPWLDSTEEAFSAPDGVSSNWDQMDMGSLFSFDSPDEDSENLGLSTFGGDEQLFSNVSPGIDLFDDGEHNFGFGA